MNVELILVNWLGLKGDQRGIEKRNVWLTEKMWMPIRLYVFDDIRSYPG